MTYLRKFDWLLIAAWVFGLLALYKTGSTAWRMWGDPLLFTMFALGAAAKSYVVGALLITTDDFPALDGVL